MSGFCISVWVTQRQVEGKRKELKGKNPAKPQPPEGLWSFCAKPYIVFALFLGALQYFLTSAFKITASIALSSS